MLWGEGNNILSTLITWQTHLNATRWWNFNLRQARGALSASLLPPKQVPLISSIIRSGAVMRYDFPAMHNSLQIVLINTSSLLKTFILCSTPLRRSAACQGAARERRRGGCCTLCYITRLHNPPPLLIRIQPTK